MVDIAKEIVPVNIEEELKRSYLDYAMSVIVGRALPDVRDGLKPVHRRVLFAMSELHNDWNKAYKKSARIVGDVIGKYHPHGDTAVYDTIVRMAQSFSLRYPLVDGQGNFGSIDGDNAAAMRYTEIRMSKIAHELLADLDKETVDFVPNYDGSEFMPSVMPTKVPNLLVNGSSGIAVGMATNIPPHNLTEVVNACLALLEDDTLEISQLMEYIQGPDFPTSGIINGRLGIVEAYRTGRGRIYMRAKSHVETDKKNRDSLVITEIPYQLNKSRLIERIAELVKEKRVEGISEIRDESDKDGLRVVIDVKRGENPDVLLNNLYAHSQLEMVYGINMVALVDGRPKLLNLKDALHSFLLHRREVVTRRTLYLLRKAKERGHLLEGLAIALANIDPIIATIKASQSTAEAKGNLMKQGWKPGNVMDMLERAGGSSMCKPDDQPAHFGLVDGLYHLTPEQAQAILDLRLQKLTGLEHEKLIAEYQARLDEIKALALILAQPERLVAVIKEELTLIRDQFGDERKTEIVASKLDLTAEDLIDDEPVVLTISNQGYAKTQEPDQYRAQKRGGRGKSATNMKEEDFIEHLLVANTHDTVLCFTTRGKVYWLKVYQIPIASRTSRGKPLVNLLPLEQDERISALLTLREFSADQFVFMATTNGTVKKVSLEQFSRPRSNGLIAIDLDEDDALIGAGLTNGEQEIMLFSSSGKGIKFNEADVRAVGRTARGVRGIRTSGEWKVISLIIPEPEDVLLMACENGFGKQTLVSEFSTQGRGGQGVIAISTSDRNGALVSVVRVKPGDDIMLISNLGTLVRTNADSVSIQGRNTQGVTLIKMSEGESLVRVGKIDEGAGSEEDGEAVEGDGVEGDDVEGDGVEGSSVEDSGSAATKGDEENE